MHRPVTPVLVEIWDHISGLQVMKPLIAFLKVNQERVMTKIYELRERAWKRKAVKRGTALRDLRKKLARTDQRRQVLLAERDRLRQENEQLKKSLGLFS